MKRISQILFLSALASIAAFSTVAQSDAYHIPRDGDRLHPGIASSQSLILSVRDSARIILIDPAAVSFDGDSDAWTYIDSDTISYVQFATKHRFKLSGDTLSYIGYENRATDFRLDRPTTAAVFPLKDGDIVRDVWTGHMLRHGAMMLRHVKGESTDRVESGWTLNAGGAVTRTILGKPDQPMTDSYVQLPCYSDTFISDMLEELRKTGGGPGMDYISSIVGENDSHDTESDRYSFNVAGHAGVFRYSYTDREYVILNNSNWLVEALNAGPRFRIVSNDGVEYEFDEEECSGIGPTDTEPPYPTAWYVTRIGTPYGDILFTYGSGCGVTVRHTDIKATSGVSLEMTEHETLSGGIEYWFDYPRRKRIETSCYHFSYQQRPLESIEWNGGKVVFEYDEGVRYETLKRLTSMKVYDTSGNMRKSVAFDNTDNWPAHKSSNGRRMLTKVCDSETGTWFFEYYRSVLLPEWSVNPSPNCLAQNTDLWGFLNTSLPSSQDCVFTEKQSAWLQDGADYTAWRIGTRDRTPSLEHTKAGVLTSVTFPTGGKVTYSYELNRFTNMNYGGLRVKSYTVFDNADLPGMTTSFEYKGAYQTMEYPEDLMCYLSYRQMKPNPDYGTKFLGEPWPETLRTCVPFPINPVSGCSCPVVYTDVTETRPDGTRVRYLYDENELSQLYGVGTEYEHPSLYYQSISDWGVREPLLLSRTVYDAEGNPLLEEKHTYDRKTLRTFSTGVRTVCPYYEYMVPPNIWQPVTVTPELVAGFGMLQHKASSAYVRANLLKSTTVREPVSGFSTTVSYDYDASLRTMRPRSVSYVGSDGSTLRTEYTYPFDLSDATSIDMVEKYIMTDAVIRKSVYSGTSLVAKTVTGYGLYSGWYYPVSISSWSAPTASSLQQPPSTLPEREKVGSYNTKGRPTSITVNATDQT
ncbi:MAG: hypothetical protein K2H72_03245, partial [Muribaculaceae bacterium]|nr:hypothetical protein [Muribaculaceae bacterium]